MRRERTEKFLSSESEPSSRPPSPETRGVVRPKRPSTTEKFLRPEKGLLRLSKAGGLEAEGR